MHLLGRRPCARNLRFNPHAYEPIIHVGDLPRCDFEMKNEEGLLFIKKTISIAEVMDILENPPPTVVSVPPQKPKGGQAFLYQAENESKKGKVFTVLLDQRTKSLSFYTCDQYRWLNQGVTKFPRKAPKIRRMYFAADTSERDF